MIDPSHGMDQPVKAGRLCGKCGYELTGLRVGTPCPECGTNIPPNRGGGTTKHDTLTAAGSDYLDWLRKRTMLMAFAAIGLAVGLVFLGRWPLVCVLASLLWMYSVLEVTRPKPMRPGLVEPPEREMRTARSLAFRSQVGWVVGSVLAFVAMRTTGVVDTVLMAGSALAILAGIVGTIPLSLWLGELADWGRDESLGRRFRTSAWLISLLAVVFLVVLAQFASGLLGPVLGLLNIIALWAGIGATVGLGLFVVCLLQMVVLTQNAMANAVLIEGREERMRAKKLEAEQRSGHAGPGEIRRPAGRPIPCPECGYDLTGLPGDTPCPECGTQRGQSIHSGTLDRFRVRPPPVVDTTPIPLEGGVEEEPAEPGEGGSKSRKQGIDRPEDVKPYDLAD